MSSLSERAGLLIAANFLKYVVGFALPIVLVRLLSQGEYGTYQQLILIGTAALGVMTLGLPPSIYYFYHNVSDEKRAALIVQTSLMLACSALFAAAVAVTLAQPIAERVNNQAVGELLPLYALSIFFVIASEHSTHFLIAQNRYKLTVVLEVSETIVRVFLLLLPLWLGFGFYGLIVGIVIFSALRWVVRMIYLIRCEKFDFTRWTQDAFFGRQVSYSLPLALIAFLGVAATTVNRGLIATSFSTAEYAIYAVGALEIPLDVIFQASVANVLRASLPPLVRDGHLSEVVRLMREAVRKLAIIVLPSFVFLIGNAEKFISMLFTNQYLDSVPVFQIYLWLVPLHMFVLSPIPQVFGKPRLNLYVNTIVFSTMIIASYFLLRWIGFYGPALAIVGCQYLGTIVFLIVASKLTKASIRTLLPISAIFRVVVASLGALVVSQLANLISVNPIFSFLLSGVIFSASFLALGILTHAFTKQDLRLAKKWYSRMVPRQRQ